MAADAVHPRRRRHGRPQQSPLHPPADLGPQPRGLKVFDRSTGFRLPESSVLSPHASAPIWRWNSAGRGCGWSLRRSGWGAFRAALSGLDFPQGPGWSSDRLTLSPAPSPQSFPPDLLHRWIAHAIRPMAQEHQHLGGVEVIHRGWSPRNPRLSAECFALALRRLLG